MRKGPAVPIGQILDGAVTAEVAAVAVTSPTVVILPGAVWKSELEAELLRLGIAADQAPRAAAHALH